MDCYQNQIAEKEIRNHLAMPIALPSGFIFVCSIFLSKSIHLSFHVNWISLKLHPTICFTLKSFELFAKVGDGENR